MKTARPVPPDCYIEKAAVPAGMSYDSFLQTIRDAAQASIRGAYSPNDDYPGYVVEIYEDFLIYYLYTRSETEGSMHLRAGWTITDGKIVIGEWVQVVELTQYVEVRKQRWSKTSIFDSLFT